jgi:hypothetical protein
MSEGGVSHDKFFRLRIAWEIRLKKQTHKWLPLIGLIIACSWPALALAKGQSQTVTALKLEQSHCTIGKVEVLISDQAVKITINKSHTFLVARAPTWKVVWYRNDPNVAYETSLAEWCKTGTKLVPLGGLGERPFDKVGVTNINGQHIIKLHNQEEKKTVDVWFVDDRTKPIQACRILAGLFRVPEQKGVPYRCKLTYRLPDIPVNSQVSWTKTSSLFEKAEGTRLDTTKISKVNVANSEFDYPRGYKIAKFEQGVWLSSGATEAVDDLLNMPTLDYKKKP